MSLDIKGLIAGREAERYQLHADHLNEQMVHVLKTIGFDKRYQRGVGQYLYDERGERYLDLLSGWGVFAVGRSHPTVRQALSAVLDSELPNLVQMGVSALSGIRRVMVFEFFLFVLSASYETSTVPFASGFFSSVLATSVVMVFLI